MLLGVRRREQVIVNHIHTNILIASDSAGVVLCSIVDTRLGDIFINFKFKIKGT